MKKMKFLLPILVILALVFASCENPAGEESTNREGGALGVGGDAGDGGAARDVEINLISILPDSKGNGSTDKTKKLILTFNREIPGLTAADIDVKSASLTRPWMFDADRNGSTYKGTLTHKGGGVYELTFSLPSGGYSGFPRDGGTTGNYYVRCSVSVIKDGYTFTPPNRVVQVYPQDVA